MRICDLLEIDAVRLDSNPRNKEDAIRQLVGLIDKTGCLTDKEQFCLDVLKRESEGSTGLGEGVAIPHAKSFSVKRPGFAAMVIKNGVPFDSLDGQDVNLIFLIASPNNASEAHLDVLARLSTLLIDQNFRQSLISAKTVDEFFSYINQAEGRDILEKEKKEQEKKVKEDVLNSNDINENQEKNTKVYDLVAVTACPAGLSHTYMAAEALEKKALELGLTIKVETDGAAGNRNTLLPEDISNAKAVIVAADRAVKLERFLGKKLVCVGVAEGVRHPKNLIEKALDEECPIYTGQMTFDSSMSLFMRIYRHLMSGLTYILPLVSTAGILLSFSHLPFLSETKTASFLDSIGFSIGTMIFPVFSAFIAFSIAGRLGLAAGVTGGITASIGDSGIVGALCNGFIAGYIAFSINYIFAKIVKGHDAILALILYPLLGALAVTLIAEFFTKYIGRFVDSSLQEFFYTSSPYILAIAGAILATMMVSDMGGPLNKIAYAIGVLSIADEIPFNGLSTTIMTSVMLGGMIPPIILGLSCIIKKDLFTKEEQQLRFKTLLLGLLFITEAALPYLKYRKIQLQSICILAAAISGGLAMALKICLFAPHGGILLAPITNDISGYFVALGSGTFIGVFLILFYKILDKK